MFIGHEIRLPATCDWAFGSLVYNTDLKLKLHIDYNLKALLGSRRTLKDSDYLRPSLIFEIVMI